MANFCNRKFNTSELKKRLIEILPVGPKYFPDDQLSDKSERFFKMKLLERKFF